MSWRRCDLFVLRAALRSFKISIGAMFTFSFSYWRGTLSFRVSISSSFSVRLRRSRSFMNRVLGILSRIRQDFSDSRGVSLNRENGASGGVLFQIIGLIHDAWSPDNPIY